MRRLSLIIGTVVLFMSMKLFNSSPHGVDFKMNCEDCHTTEGWTVDPDSISFNHNNTAMPLEGQHREIGCRACHQSLIFRDAETACSQCHTDIHENTVGQECDKCHTSRSWIITDIIGLHRQTRFPLLGAHSMAECSDCHKSPSLLKFEPLGIECFDCHSDDFFATTSPNHQQGGYSKNCTDCHFMNSFTWTGAGVNHDFFPLREGHANVDCFSCHTDGSFSQISNACITCHQPDFNATANPNHSNLDFSTECNQCHTLAPGWRPAKFGQHDGIFPIYSGEHNGEWEQCSDCHKNSSNYSVFTCLDCHEHNQSDMNGEHEDVQGYEYNSEACYACHPTGSGEGSFNHSTTAFPLTGAHIDANCQECHSNGYQGTSTFCYDCHTPDFQQAANPDHDGNNFPNTCADCHTTEPGWKPATFAIHNQYYALNGAHAAIASNCSSCHEGSYNNTPNTCSGCHLPDYNATTSPSHVNEQFPTECLQCHNENAWIPSTFNHQNTGFPLTGAHTGASCSDCHQSGYNGTSTVCYDCHQIDFQQSVNPSHTTLNIPNTCSDCHSTQPGWAPATFTIHNQYYQLNGAHAAIANDCNACHNGNYNTTPNTCGGCHIQDYNATTNPNHASAQFPTDCLECHTETSWEPSTFEHDNNFPIYSGQHQGEWNTCSDCHPNPSNFAVFTCLTCHEQGETNEDHEGIPGYSYNSAACLNCHPDGSENKQIQIQRNKIK